MTDQSALDREILAFMAERLDRLGEEESGFYPYYTHRVARGMALADYEYALLPRLLDRRLVVHAGVGIGTLTVSLARRGVDCLGFEFDERRYLAAVAMRDALAPETRYRLRKAKFPDGLLPRDVTGRATLLFTNVGRGWDEPLVARMIEAMHGFRSAILDLRQFGWTREDEVERDCLREQIVAAGFTVEPIVMQAFRAHYVEARSTRPVPLARRVRGQAIGVLDRLGFRARGLAD